jgi:integral membrane protein
MFKRGLAGALTRFRTIAWVVGVLLLALTLVAMPMKYFGDNSMGVALIAPIHGWCYVLYLGAVGDLARRVQSWSVPRILLVALAGTVPFLSFFIERQVRQWVQLPEEPAAAQAG